MILRYLSSHLPHFNHFKMHLNIYIICTFGSMRTNKKNLFENQKNMWQKQNKTAGTKCCKIEIFSWFGLHN